MGIISVNSLQRIRASLFLVLILVELSRAQDTIRIPVGGRWRLECPRVGYRANEDRATVTWTQNNAIWLKIENSNVTISNQLMSMHRSRMGASNILNIVSNNFRYKFYYDETVGVYELTITNAEPDDSGLWVCYVAIDRIQGGQTEEFTSDGNLIVGKSAPIPSVTEDRGKTDDDEAYDDIEGGQTDRQGSERSKQGQRQKLHAGHPLNATGNATGHAISDFRAVSLPVILFSLTIATAAGTL